MRIWDVSPGYLNRQSLLGEHRELHGLVSILVNGKKGYSRHPETVRWVGCLSGLARRHAWLVAEMELRGYRDRSPVADAAPGRRWPAVFVTTPARQFDLLRAKYEGRERGRILLPSSTRELWAQHEYSVMARDPELHRVLGRRVARLRRASGFDDVAAQLAVILRADADRGPLATALEHLWGHVGTRASAADRHAAHESPLGMLRTTQRLAVQAQEPSLMASTALSDLAVLLDGAVPPHAHVEEPPFRSRSARRR